MAFWSDNFTRASVFGLSGKGGIVAYVHIDWDAVCTELVKHKSTLQNFQISHCAFSRDTFIALTNALPQLVLLSIDNCNIFDDAIEILITKLPKTLVKLYLHCNSIKNDGAIALAGWIPTCPKLELINLNNNQIGTQGSDALCLVCLPRRIEVLLERNYS